MKRELQTGILAASVVAACMVSRAQTNIYSLNVSSYINLTGAGDVMEYMNGWSGGSPSNRFGFCHNRKIHYPEPGNGPIQHPVYTTIYYGPHSVSTRAPASVLGLGALFMVGLAGWLAADAYGRMRE